MKRILRIPNFTGELFSYNWPPHSPEFLQAQAIYQKLLDMGLRPYRAELSMYNKRLDCAGQADLVMQDAEGKKVIVDWKRVRQLHWCYGRK